MADANLGVTPIRALRRVVPIARTEVRNGLALTLFALEDYADGFDLKCRLFALNGHPIFDFSAQRNRTDEARLHALLEKQSAGGASNVAPMIMSFDVPPDLPRESSGPLWPEPHWEALDDRGNSYHATDQFKGGEFASGEFRIELKFEPALNLEAHYLRIRVAEISWIPFPTRREKQPPVRVDLGPWEFSIDLSAGLDVVQTGEPE